MLFVLLFLVSFCLNFALATPAPGSTISNVASLSAQTAALQAASAQSNTVAVVVAAPSPASLTKSFATSTITVAETTSLTFLLTNASGNPTQQNLGFTDVLPTGLALSPSATSTISAGCTGNMQFAQPGTISFAAGTMAAGTSSCTITVTGIISRNQLTNASCATNPAAFTNAASSISGLSHLTNAVTPQCLVVHPGTPLLSKSFTESVISTTTSTSLVFTLTNAQTSPAQSGLSFVDTLPAGLAISANATSAISAGCTGNVQFAGPGTISFAAGTMASGTGSCTITISGITSRNQATNASCATNPAAFTNAATSISGLTNLTNAVTPQCLVVQALILDQVAPRCTRDTPYVDYAISTVGVNSGLPLTIRWINEAGQTVRTLTNQPFTGALLWPGAAVDANGNPTAWPGWQFTNGNWVQIADGLRPNMRLEFSINPTSVASFSYPSATPACNPNPPMVPPPPPPPPVSPPSLTKIFASGSISNTTSTSLIFTLTNAPGAPAQAGISFVDSLPAGLAISANASSTIGVGCTGNVQVVAPGTISFAAGTMAAGTTECSIRVDGVSSRNQVTNTTCANNPAAFTNAATSISGLMNVVNAVTPQCLLVEQGVPTVTKAFASPGIAVNGTTALTFTISNVNGAPAQAGMSFVDMLPSGLALTANPSAALSSGCVGNVQFVQPSTINFAAGKLAAGVTSCTVTIDGVRSRNTATNNSCSGNPSAFTNDAASLSGVTGLVNAVTPQCLVVSPVLPPTLTKAFTSSSIATGGQTGIRFTLTNTTGNPAQSGIAFLDTLPSGLQLTASPSIVQTGGCTGNVQFSPPRGISFAAGSMLAGVSSCTITVTGITAQAGVTNTSCAGNPPAFTNSASSMSGLAAVTNAVTPQCLVVAPPLPVSLPTLTKSFTLASITTDTATPLVFTLTNGAGNPAQSGITFVDTLPAGLALTSSTSFALSTGCSGSVEFSAPGTISFSSGKIAAGTAACTISVTGVTSRAGATNLSCVGSPAAFTNSSSSISGLASLVNGVSPRCLVVNPGAFSGAPPSLTKSFQRPSVLDGEDVPLTFTITASSGNPGFAGVGFIDTLPTGLRLRANPTVSISGTGCKGQVNFSQPSLILVTDLSAPAGTEACQVVVSGVTNATGALNSSCDTNPRAFTNREVSITGLTRLRNDVEPQCMVVQPNPAYSMQLSKLISRSEGVAPFLPVTMRLPFSNPLASANATKRQVVIADTLPNGMTLVPNSLRLVMGNNTTVLSGSRGQLTVQGREVSFVAETNRMSITLASLLPGEFGTVIFDVAIGAGVSPETVLTNVAQLTYTNAAGLTVGPVDTNPVSYKVNETIGVTLRGMTIPSVGAGSTVLFDNIVTNVGSRTDTFDIVVSNSSFPVGSLVRLFRADGVTPLADSNGNGVADTGPIAGGASYKVVVQVQLPAGVVGGPYRLTKTAQSVTRVDLRASDDDVVSAVAKSCRVALEPNNAGTVRAAEFIDYTHVLTNQGSCVEEITIPPNFLRSSLGWSVVTVIDSPVTAGASIAWSIDPTDERLVAGRKFTLQPGQRVVFLVRVPAPVGTPAGTIDVTDFTVNNSDSKALVSVRNTTTVVATATGANGGGNILQGFIDNGFQRPTVWAFIGREFFLRANAAACNAEPDVIERRTIIITGPNGEREVIIATETGPNTGQFITDALPVRRPPATAEDAIIQGEPYDTFDIEIVGCGRKITTTTTLIDPNGVVFDSRTNEPVAGATVRLVTAVNGVCTQTLATVRQLLNMQIVSSPSTVVTRADGRYDFPLVPPGDYCLDITPPNGYTWRSTVPTNELAVGRIILSGGPFSTSGGSYGGAFRVGPETGPVIVDSPVDPGPIGGLFIKKDTLRSTVEVGEFTDYTITVNNATGIALTRSDVFVTDTLPHGFSYVAGSSRLDGKPLADPQGGAGPVLVFNVGRLAKDAQPKLTYRVRIGPVAMRGDGINRAVASYRAGASGQFSQSNTAMAKVNVVGGVFSDRAYIVGKVFADCSADGLQNPRDGDRQGEVGVPGVRLYLEDGTNATTDAEGKYSFYGISPRTHVLKIDRSTLPGDVLVSDLGLLSNRNLGKGDSRIVDLKAGELHKANFAITSCQENVRAEIAHRRRSAARVGTELDGRLQQALSVAPSVPIVNQDVKGLPASGTISAGSAPAPAPLSAPTPPTAIPAKDAKSSAGQADGVAPANSFSTLADTTDKPVANVGAGLRQDLEERTEPPLEQLLPTLDNVLGFVNVTDGQRLTTTQPSLRVKGLFGTTFRLSVGGVEVPANRVGKKTSLESKQVQAWEFFGVDLKPGKNTVKVEQLDGFGNARGEASLTIIAPGVLSEVRVEYGDSVRSRGGAMADGKTPAQVRIRLLDKDGNPVVARTQVTLVSSAGRWDVVDANPRETGSQTFVEGGEASFSLLPPTEPARAQLQITAGKVKTEAALDFLPDLRDLIASGVVEGIINLRKFDARKLLPTRDQDNFETEITHLTRHWNDGKTDAGARAAMFIKGKVRGDYLLTLAYDSDKTTRERLFRDIQPDEFYPVYGDSAVRGFDAQSTGKFYLRVDNKKSYMLYGDYNTNSTTENRRLTNYNRSLTGLKQHYENSSVSANVFASRDSTRQVIDEFRANGTSGPFVLTRAGGLINSETVEVLTRDRDQTGVILRTEPLSRFVDYEIEPLTGRILLKAPVASLDEKLNPKSLRITYESDQGGPQFWSFGADAQFKVTKSIELGAVVVSDQNPLNRFKLAGVNSVVKLAEKSFLVAEYAQTEREQFVGALSQGEQSGRASRVELRHSDKKLEFNLAAGRAGLGFDNPTSSLSKGRAEVSGKLAYKLDDVTRFNAEILRSEDVVSGSKRDGALLTAERSFANKLRLEFGLRHAKDSVGRPLPQTTTALPGDGTSVPSPTPTPTSQNEVTAARVKLSGPIPGVEKSTIYAEAEVDLQETGRKMLAIGGDYLLPNNGKLYARHEFASSITGPYGLGMQQTQNATVVGVNTEYIKNGSLFSEYRIKDSMAGGDTEAAVGLRHTWKLRDGLNLQGGFERVHAVAGSRSGESTSGTIGLEYTANPLWKGSTRLELRDSTNSSSILSTVAVASKLNQEWTFLGRNAFSSIKNKGAATGENEQNRLQLGVAYRDLESDVWSGLAKAEHRTEKDTTQKDISLKRSVELVSLHANWQPRRPFTFSGRLAAKWVTDNSNGVTNKSQAQLVSGRAIWEIAPRWDASLNLSTMMANGRASQYYGVGVELGYMVMENLWLSAGYNFFGYTDKDLTSGEYTNKGAFVRMRYKFDEDLFASKKRSAVIAPKVAVSTPEVSQAPAAAPPVVAPQADVRAEAPVPAIAPVLEAPQKVEQATATNEATPLCRVRSVVKKQLKKTPVAENATPSPSKKPRRSTNKQLPYCGADGKPVADSVRAPSGDEADDDEMDVEEFEIDAAPLLGGLLQTSRASEPIRETR